MKSPASVLTACLLLGVALSSPARSAETLPGSASAVASVTTRSALTQLGDERTGQVFLVVTNTSKAPVTIVRVKPFKPSFVKVSPEDATAFPIAVPPGHSKAIPYKVEGDKAVETGEQLVLWQLDLTWMEGPVRQEGSLLAEARFQVKVIGESEILNALQVPSLLLLPGVLFVLVLNRLRRALPGKEGEPAAAPTLADSLKELIRAESVLVGVLFSLAMAFVYPLMVHRDFRILYGFRDVWNICAMSVAAAFVVVGIGWAYRRGAEEWRLRRMPLKTDGPVETLLKLARRGARSVALPQLVPETAGGGAPAVFLLAEDKTGYWTAPAIRVDERAVSAPGLRDRLEALLESGRPGALAGFFREHQELRPRWKTRGQAETGLQRVETATAGKVFRRPVRRIVEL